MNSYRGRSPATSAEPPVDKSTWFSDRSRANTIRETSQDRHQQGILVVAPLLGRSCNSAQLFNVAQQSPVLMDEIHRPKQIIVSDRKIRSQHRRGDTAVFAHSAFQSLDQNA